MQNRKENPLSVGAGFQKMAQVQTDKKMIARFLELDMLCANCEPDDPAVNEYTSMLRALNKRWKDKEFQTMYTEARDARKNNHE